MEGLITDAAFKFIERSYICVNQPICSAAEFLEWPERRNGNWTADLPLEEFASRIQSWLFFGLLAACFPDFRQEEDIREDDDGHRVFDACCLRRLMEQRRRTETRLWRDMALESVEHAAANTLWGYSIKHVLKVAIGFMNDTDIRYLRELGRDGRSSLWTTESFAVVFACDVLIDLLYNVSNGYFTQVHLSQGRRSLPVELCYTAVRSGRFPSLGRRLRPTASRWSWVLSLPRVTSIDYHSACIEDRCCLNDIDGQDYQT